MRQNCNQKHAASTIAGSVLATLLTIFLPLGCAQASSREKIVRQNPCPLSAEDEYGYSFSFSHRTSPLSPRLESVLLEEASKEFVTAATDWMNARSANVEAQIRMMRTHPNADKERLEVASKLINLDSADLTARKTELSKLCTEIIDLRIAAARKPGGAAREIELLQQETARLRSEASVSADEFHARYQAETKRLAASAANVDEYMKVIASQIAEAKKIRERLKQP